jgi:hypothetical protein
MHRLVRVERFGLGVMPPERADPMYAYIHIMKSMRPLIGIALVMTAARSASGQSRALDRVNGDTAHAITAAISSARRDGYASGDLVVFASARVRLSIRDAGTIADALKGRFTATSPIACPNGAPGSCKLDPGTVAVEVIGYRELDTIHIVDLRFAQFTGSKRQPIHYTDFSVTLATKNGEWAVAKIERVSDS